MYSFYRQQENSARQQTRQINVTELQQAKQRVAQAQANYDHAVIVYNESYGHEGRQDAQKYMLNLGRILAQAQEELRQLERES